MRDVLATLDAESVHACVTDPPYHLTNNMGTRSPYPGQYTPIGRPQEPKGGFMGRAWDGGSIAFDPDTWREVYRVLKPGAHLLAFGGTRTAHRMTCAIEDAGFEIRDTLCWLYGSGFPKSLDVSKAIDATLTHGNSHSRSMKRANETRPGEPRIRATTMNNGIMGDNAGPKVTRDTPATDAARQWQGWGTALKPAHEPIILARKPLIGTVAANVLAHGTGAINVDACRIGTTENLNGGAYSGDRRLRDCYTSTDHDPGATPLNRLANGAGQYTQPLGRWPANVVHDGSPEVEAAFAAFGERTSSAIRDRVGQRPGGFANVGADKGGSVPCASGFNDTGTASRFFYTAKADRADRADSKHPTVKPVDLMRWLVRMVTPPGGTVLDPFAGSGTTGEAAMLEGFNAMLIEREAEHVADIRHRIKRWSGGDTPLFAAG